MSMRRNRAIAATTGRIDQASSATRDTDCGASEARN